MKETLKRKVFYLLPSEIEKIKKEAKKNTTSESQIVRKKFGFIKKLSTVNREY